ncbi:MAG: bacteriocin immunity protein [Pantoea piersonii]|nr:bacteriocin immunity protein [Pantoea piersonii]MBZ6387990.1 bacteriocin immunity protein [Pantoea piersonii]MBZ6401071.1 bacteriocin immunity protein [Pantoea piersonii]MBZ6409301.1 bacteriocin immunity protein [Pantoea piersonii]MBZ6428186.1 bacteriocin immunity protein [Pantoea piersonii]
MSEIFSAEGSETYQARLLDNFIAAGEHPDGSDWIFYNDDPGLTAENISKQ